MKSRGAECTFRANSWAIPALWGTLALLAVAGCGATPHPSPKTETPTELDLVTVIKTVYELEGDGRGVLFVGLDGYTDDTLDTAVLELAEQLPVTVLRSDEACFSDLSQPALTPVHPETGQPGLGVRVFSIEQIGLSTAEAHIAFSRSGLDGGDLLLSFEWTPLGWTLTDWHRAAQA
ncbi:MAG: hypothetical protein KAV82_07020 [Phycisphaerae bacterium]|nr:hypothetical protein [Phycisphaerae bacterium]